MTQNSPGINESYGVSGNQDSNFTHSSYSLTYSTTLQGGKRQQPTDPAWFSSAQTNRTTHILVGVGCARDRVLQTHLLLKEVAKHSLSTLSHSSTPQDTLLPPP